MKTCTVDRRFRGPPDSGNGGYVCGLVAAAAPGPVAVRLRRPPPLGVPLALTEHDGLLRLTQEGEIVAEARPDPVEIEVPAALAPEAAATASLRYVGFDMHPFPGCFVCGPQRPPGDGLRIFPGPVVEGGTMVAAPWVPDESLGGPGGMVRSEFLWAALDCPGYLATPMAGRMALLGELAARIEGPVRVGERCVVMGWGCRSEGRKHFAGTALFGPDGGLIARAAATWIEPRP